MDKNIKKLYGSDRIGLNYLIDGHQYRNLSEFQFNNVLNYRYTPNIVEILEEKAL